MREIIAFENVTVDGLMAGASGELDWATRDQEVEQYTREGGYAVDTFLFGRVTYEMMAAFWPTPAGKAASPVFADALNNNAKIVFSTTLQKADWQRTRIVREISSDSIQKLKQMPGESMMIFGSGTVVTQLAALGLIDEYQLMVNPVVLGRGKPLFNNLTDRLGLQLVGTRTFTSGLVLLRYRTSQPR